MQANTICLRCHQKCHITVDVVDGRVVAVVDASSLNRIPPCRELCPIGMDVPGYMIAVSRGEFTQAMEIIRETNPFPMVCGRICHHPCESECIRGIVDEPVAIQGIKRFAADRAAYASGKPVPIKRMRKETIGIVGSGPAGLTAAYDLVRAGYGVTVYEAAATAGGMLSRVIPEFKLPAAAVWADIQYLQDLGVVIQTGMEIGKDPTFGELRRRHETVLLAVGSWASATLKIPGVDLEGVHHALPFLEDIRRGNGIPLKGSVVVIGGGNTAMDAARAAVRQGAAKVQVACLECAEKMPALPREIENARREGVRIFPALAPQMFRDDGKGSVSGVAFQRVACTELDDEGKIRWTLQEGEASSSFLKADTVIIAIGQTPDRSALHRAGALEWTPQGTLRVDPETMACGAAGFFAAGDVVVGAGTVVESMAAGRKAATSIIRSLGGVQTERAEIPVEESLRRARLMVNKDSSGIRKRVETPLLSREEAVHSYREVEAGYDETAGRAEADRCINCQTICVKGATIADLMYHPDRLRYPLRRTGARGEGKWERISWDEALDTIAARLMETKEKCGPEGIHISCGSGQKHIGIQATKIAERLWPTPNTHLGRYTCIHPDVMANSVTFGDTITYEFGPDYAHSKCIVFWGSNPDVGTPAQARDIHRSLRQGAKLLVVDPRPIAMAKRADLWLRIRPGTDMALALAMQHVIIDEGLYDREFVDQYCFGFDKLREHVQKYTPEWAAGVTGLSVGDIVAATRMYATTKPGTIYIRLGAGAQQVTSTQTCRSISSLIGITGNVDVKGGNLLYYRTFRENLFWHPYLMFWGVKPPAAVNAKRIGAKEFPLMHKRAICHVPSTIQAMEEGKVRALWCVADNLLVAEMDNRRIWNIMKNKLDFIFVSELFMTPTAELADIVLPAAFYPECDQLVEAFGHPSSTVTAARRVVEPLGESRDDREVAIEIAKRMGMDVSPWNTLKDYLNWMLKYQGITFDELCEKPSCCLTFPKEYERFRTSLPAFSTASGKVELYSQVFEAMGLDPLPVYNEPPESPIRTPDLFREFPFIYTHYRTHGFMHSEGRQIRRQRQLAPEPYLEMNDERAANLGIADGDWVTLETPRSAGKASIRFKARLVKDMHPDVVAGSHAWWFPEKPAPEHGCFDSNINALLSLDPPYDPVVGVPQCRAVLCRVVKADASA